MKKNIKISKCKLLDQALIVAMKLKYSYKGYESKEKAFEALKRQSKGFDRQQCKVALEKGINLYKDSEKIVAKNATKFAKAAKDKFTGMPDMKNLEKELVCKHKGFNKNTYSSSIAWAYYWTIMR